MTVKMELRADGYYLKNKAKVFAKNITNVEVEEVVKILVSYDCVSFITESLDIFTVHNKNLLLLETTEEKP